MCDHDYRIAAVATWTCRFDLRTPILLDDLEIRSREYVIVRITTEGGLQGVAFALSRSAPVGSIVDELLAPIVLGEDALSIPRLLERIDRQLRLLGTDGVVQRAISLVDICLWDIKAKAANLPLWRLLGGFRAEAPALLVDSFPQQGQSEADLVEALVLRAQEGYAWMKIHCHNDPEATRSFLAATRDALGPQVQLVLDAVMPWRDPSEAISAIRLWEPYRLAWVEDPFRAERVDWIKRVREATRVAIGAGDEVASPSVMRTLVSVGAVDVVRLDATVHGGVTGFASLAAHALAEGCPVSAHVYPEIHQHCAFAWPGISHIELFAPASKYDCTDAFVTPESLVRAVSGQVLAPEQPGIGLEIDWAAVSAQAVHRTESNLPGTTIGTL